MIENDLWHYLNSLYADIDSSQKNNILNISETYGEVLYPSIDKLISIIKWQDDDIFYDLGSGLGKVALRIFFKTNIKIVHGIELRYELHHVAQTILAKIKIQKDLFPSGRELIFSHGDFLKNSFKDASILFIASPCFSLCILDSLANIINVNPNIQTVLTLKPMPALARLKFQRAVRIDCSWDTALCYIYQ